MPGLYNPQGLICSPAPMRRETPTDIQDTALRRESLELLHLIDHSLASSFSNQVFTSSTGPGTSQFFTVTHETKKATAGLAS